MAERLDKNHKAGETLSPFLKRVLRAAAEGNRLHGPNLAEAAKSVGRRIEAEKKRGSD